MTRAELARASRLSTCEIQAIDDALLSEIESHRWLKTARVVWRTLRRIDPTIEGVPDLFVVERIRLLVEQRRVEARGDLSRMRFSELRIGGSESDSDSPCSESDHPRDSGS